MGGVRVWGQRRSALGAFNCPGVFNRVNINWSISGKVAPPQWTLSPVTSRRNYIPPENWLEYCNPVNVKRRSEASAHLSSSVMDAFFFIFRRFFRGVGKSRNHSCHRRRRSLIPWPERLPLCLNSPLPNWALENVLCVNAAFKIENKTRLFHREINSASPSNPTIPPGDLKLAAF